MIINNTQDLFLSKDILPSFDYTLNPDSRSKLEQLLQQPLSSVAEIKDKQAILGQIIAFADATILVVDIPPHSCVN